MFEICDQPASILTFEKDFSNLIDAAQGKTHTFTVANMLCVVSHK